MTKKCFFFFPSHLESNKQSNLKKKSNSFRFFFPKNYKCSTAYKSTYTKAGRLNLGLLSYNEKVEPSERKEHCLLTHPTIFQLTQPHWISTLKAEKKQSKTKKDWRESNHSKCSSVQEKKIKMLKVILNSHHESPESTEIHLQNSRKSFKEARRFYSLHA